jgi:chromosome segregation ATPase
MATMGDFYDLALRRQRRIVALEAERADMRARLDVLEEAINERDCELVELRDELAERDRRIDALEAFPIGRRDGL